VLNAEYKIFKSFSYKPIFRTQLMIQQNGSRNP